LKVMGVVVQVALAAVPVLVVERQRSRVMVRCGLGLRASFWVQLVRAKVRAMASVARIVLRCRVWGVWVVCIIGPR